MNGLIKNSRKNTLLYSLNIFHFTEILQQLYNMKGKKKDTLESNYSPRNIKCHFSVQRLKCFKMVHKYLGRRKRQLRSSTFHDDILITQEMLMYQPSATSIITAFTVWFSFQHFIL